MARTVVTVDNLAYSFSPDDLVPVAGRRWAVVRLHLTDELTGTAPRGAVTLSARQAGLYSRLVQDGLAALTGVPRNIFPALATQSYTVDLSVQAEGYVPVEAQVQVPQDNHFPASFTPPPLLTLSLHRQPVVISGRTVRLSAGTTQPVAGVTVTVTGIWRTVPPANQSVNAAPPNLVLLQPPLYSGQAAPIGQLQGQDLLPVTGDDKQLLDAVPAGANPIRLSNRQNLAVGDLLLIDAGNSDLAEYLAIAAITGASTPDQPARVTLTYPVAYPHRQNALIKKLNLQAPGVDEALADAVIAGDSCVFLNSVSGLAGFSQVRLGGGPNPAAYHRLSLFTATSDSEGYYRLPPLSRVAQLALGAEKAPLTSVQTEFRPDYTVRENRLDFIFS
jgi:hypothetical protein